MEDSKKEIHNLNFGFKKIFTKAVKKEEGSSKEKKARLLFTY